jgi:hypothetical protein
MLLMLAVHVVMAPYVHASSLLSHPDHSTTFILGIQVIPIKYFIHDIYLIRVRTFAHPLPRPWDYDLTLIT